MWLITAIPFQHYNAYINSAESGQWFVFDDTNVVPVGKEWSKVKGNSFFPESYGVSH